MAKSDKTRHKRELSIAQLNAVELLVMGKTDKETAEAVGVQRTTVTFWRLYNLYFQAELNRRRKEVWWAAVDRFRGLLLRGLDTVEKAIIEGDAKTAIELLKMAGLDVAKSGDTLLARTWLDKTMQGKCGCAGGSEESRRNVYHLPCYRRREKKCAGRARAIGKGNRNIGVY